MHFQMIAEGALGIGTQVGSTLLRKKKEKRADKDFTFASDEQR